MKCETELGKALHDIGERVEASDELKCRIDRRLIQMEKEKQNMKRFSVKRVVIGVAAACLMVGTVCVAGSGLKSYVCGGSAIPEYTKFEDLTKAEQEAGFEVNAIEKFHNGYALEGINVNLSSIVNEAGKKEEELKDIYIRYKKDGKGFFLTAHELFESEDPETIVKGDKVPDQVIQVGDVEVVFNHYTYKFVPVGYELTEEDKKNLERDDYEISYGADEIQIGQYMSVTWLDDGILYHIGGHDLSFDAEEMLNMAKEVIENGK